MKKLTIELWDAEAAFLKRAVPLFGSEEAAAVDCIRSTRERVEQGADKVALDLGADIGNAAVAKMIKVIRAELKKEFATPPSPVRCEMVVDWKLAADGESPGDEIECGKPAVARNGHVSMCGACVKYGFEQGNFEPHELLPLQGSLVELCEANAELGAELVKARSGAPAPLPEKECSGITATWCPNHGTCTCPRDDDGTLNLVDVDLSTTACPLHGKASDHPLPPLVGAEVREDRNRLAVRLAEVEAQRDLERADREKTEDALLSTNNERKDAERMRERLVGQIRAVACLDSAAGVAHKLRAIADGGGAA